MARTTNNFTVDGNFEFTPLSDETRINGAGTWGAGTLVIEEYVGAVWVAIAAYSWTADFTIVARLIPNRLHRAVLSGSTTPNLNVNAEDLFDKDFL